MLAYISIFSILSAGIFAQQTCNATLSTGPVINGTCGNNENIDTTNQLCCNSSGIITTTTTNSCVDLLNPRTGVSDCPARASYCNDATYLALMTVQCPRTCGRCSTSTNSTSCVDRINPSTGTSDCPRLSYLCNNSVYTTLMTQQCPLTCGRCNSSTSSGTATSTSSTTTCVDLTNPATGTSDCPNRRSLCTNSAYASLMRVQCPATCGFCSG